MNNEEFRADSRPRGKCAAYAVGTTLIPDLAVKLEFYPEALKTLRRGSARSPWFLKVVDIEAHRAEGHC